MKLKGKNEKPQLYDLKTDIGEAIDLAAKNPDKLKSLQTAYDAWAKDLPKPIWMNTRDE